MTLYASSGVENVSVPQPGGGQHVHTRKPGEEGPFVLNCASCEEILLAQNGYHTRLEQNGQAFLWTPNKAMVPPTSAELKEQEEVARSAFNMQSQDWEDFKAWKEMKRREREGVGPIRV